MPDEPNPPSPKKLRAKGTDSRRLETGNQNIIIGLQRLIRDFRNVQDYGNAELFCEQLMGLSNDSNDVYTYATVLFDQGKYLYAIDKLNQIVDLGNDTRDTLLLRVRCYMKLKRVEEALGVFESNQGLLQYSKGVSNPGGNRQVTLLYTTYGKVCYLLGDVQRACSLFQTALDLDFCNVDALESILRLELLTSEQELELIHRIVSKSRGEFNQYLTHLYISRMNKNMNLEIIKSSINVLQREYQLSKCLFTQISYCELLYYTYKYEDAFIVVSELIKTDPNCINLIPLYIAICYETDRQKELYALSHYLVDHYNGVAISWYCIGAYYILQGKFEEGRRFFGRATEIDPRSTLCWIGFAHSFSFAGEHDQAITAYSTASYLSPGSPFPPLFVAMEYGILRKDRLAETFLIKAQSIYKKDPFVLNELGILYYRQKRYMLALEMISNSFEIASKNDLIRFNTICSVYCNLGRICIKLKRYEDALKYYKLAYMKDTANYRFVGWLGLAYQLNGRYGKAIDCYSHALRLNPKDMFSQELIAVSLRSHSLL